jgi:voltage-gated potassium channel
MSDEQILFDQFIAVFGWDDFAQNITGQLLASSNNVVVLTEAEDEKPAIRGEFTDQQEDSLQVFALHRSDYPEMKNIGLGNAQSLFLNLGSDEQNLITILRLQKHFPDLEYMVGLTDENLEETFRSAGVTYAVSRFNISSKVLASYLYEPDVAEYTEDLLTATKNGEDYDIQQYRVTSQCAAVGEPFIDVMRTLKTDHRSTPIGLKKHDGELIKIPEPDTVVDEKDYVLLITRGEREGGLEDYFGTAEGVLNG